MPEPVLCTHVLQPPHAMNAWEFASWESLHRPEGRLFMECFHPQGAGNVPPHHPSKEPYGALDPHNQERFDRWVCVYKEYDPTTWILIND